jgi:hypothetical protein
MQHAVATLRTATPLNQGCGLCPQATGYFLSGTYKEDILVVEDDTPGVIFATPRLSTWSIRTISCIGINERFTPSNSALNLSSPGSSTIALFHQTPNPR